MPALQTKLEIGRPDDSLEREADRVAEEVLRMPPATAALSVPLPGGGGTAPTVQRLCSQCQEELQRQVADEEDEKLLQANPAGGDGPRLTPEVGSRIDAALAGSGQPLPVPVRTHFEPRFGHDFTAVRIHQGAAALESARMLNAHGWTAHRLR